MDRQRHRDPATRWSGLQSVHVGDVELVNGEVLPDVVVAYETWGTLDGAGGNAVLVEHALTGDSHVVGGTGPQHPTPGWWDGLIGPGAPLDSDELFVVATNVLGGCRGTTGPSSPAPDGRAWGSRFPRITIRDQVRVEARVADLLGIDRLRAVLGGSMGGMRAVEWAATYPERVDTAIVLASTARASAEQIAWASVQNQAIRADPHYSGGDYYDSGSAPTTGMAIAREIAQVTYRSEPELADRFGNRTLAPDEVSGRAHLDRGEGRPLFQVESYLHHHGAKLVSRFDAGSFLVLNEAMSTHDVGAGRGGAAAALNDFQGRLLVVSVDSDRLYPPSQSEELVAAHPRARHVQIKSPHGHDGFLIEREQVGRVIREALRGVPAIDADTGRTRTSA
ncbi:homoserine O-acetyltransferase [Nostocoides sp. F2B08]|uniref:homoserine O-acetyltransferase MetX n=1 Tax=Nostocoides sp. F2B08 TaxID=2653936 RepID=UPI0012636FA4|nr:homoserine O-acetyltransferase [Tetrasphaera sp. F2B08]KAB7741039.1 homoserine O-acetyltransferase [Tetrasphaera sp. F2B08]